MEGAPYGKLDMIRKYVVSDTMLKKLYLTIIFKSSLSRATPSTATYALNLSLVFYGNGLTWNITVLRVPRIRPIRGPISLIAGLTSFNRL